MTERPSLRSLPWGSCISARSGPWLLIAALALTIPGPALAEFVKERLVPRVRDASSFGITFDDEGWWLTEQVTGLLTRLDQSFALEGATMIPGVEPMAGIVFVNSRGTLFAVEHLLGDVIELTRDGVLLSRFEGFHDGLNGITYDATSDTLWLAYFGTGRVENRTFTGELLSWFTTPHLWTGIAYESRADTLLLLDNSDALWEFTKEGVGRLLFHDWDGVSEKIPRNGLGLDYDGAMGRLYVVSQTEGIVIFQDLERVVIDIDVSPARDDNEIQLRSRGLLAVALLGSEALNVTTVDPSSLAFGPAGALLAHDLANPGLLAGHLRDSNRDGIQDLLLHFRIDEAGIPVGQSVACLQGETLVGSHFEACDSAVGSRPPRCGLGFEAGIVAYLLLRRSPALRRARTPRLCRDTFD